MEAALYDPEFGYYRRSDLQRWGREGDYRTSAERSELFAATFARYFAKLYEELGQPRRWSIVEGGAGDGSFARRVQRALEDGYPRVFEATRYVISEIRNASEPFDQSNPCLYFSNELLSEFLDRHAIKLASGQTIEVNLAIDDWLTSLASQLKRGYVITVDYGAEALELYDPSLRPNGTLRAFSKHGFVDDVLSAPGEYDITSSVNWTQVKATGERLGLQVMEFESQDRFLLEAGLLDELNHRLKQIETQAYQVRLTTDAREMILPGGMASSFQVLVQKRG
jgi:SAM-dependent MidA family methyltransferase